MHVCSQYGLWIWTQYGFHGGVIAGNNSNTIDSTYYCLIYVPELNCFQYGFFRSKQRPLPYRTRRSVGAVGTAGSGDKQIYPTNRTVECWLEMVDPINPCCPPCTIASLSGLASSCNTSDSSFSISGNFIHANTSVDSMLLRQWWENGYFYFNKQSNVLRNEQFRF